VAASARDVEKDIVLLSQYNAAKCLVEGKRYPEAIAQLKVLAQQADAAGLRNISTAARFSLSQAFLGTHQSAAAKRELGVALSSSEKLGLQAAQARGQFLLALTLEASGATAEATKHYETAKRILEGIRQESGSDAILKRQDFAALTSRSARPL